MTSSHLPGFESRPSTFGLATSFIRVQRRPAFTLVEIMVVVGIIIVLLGAILSISTSVFDRAKATNTLAMMQVLDLAINQFRDEAPLAKVPGYNARYRDNFPPDELEAISPADDFVPPGPNPLPFTIMNPACAFLGAIGGGPVTLAAGVAGPAGQLAQDNGDVIAMILAIKQYSATAGSILDRVDSRYRRSLDQNPNSAIMYFDRDGSGNFVEPLEYFVDSWGTPIEYFATNDASVARAQTTDGAGLRQALSTFFIQTNKQTPLFVSYGPDGQEQLSGDYTVVNGNGSHPKPDLIGDYLDDNTDNMIDHPLNADNIYSSPDPDFADKLAASPP